MASAAIVAIVAIVSCVHSDDAPRGALLSPMQTAQVPYRVPLPSEEARLLLEQAEQTSDRGSRCQLAFRAALLDRKSAPAHLTRAKLGCAEAADLLDDARIAHRELNTLESATILVGVATRAESGQDALSGAQSLLTLGAGDLEVTRLAAHTFSTFGDHQRAARAYETIASERGSRGASIEAIDARLDAAMESARAQGLGAVASPSTDLRSAILAATPIAADYGGAWVGAKVVEAIAVLRNASDELGANQAAALALHQRLFSVAETNAAFEIERAIGAARGGSRQAVTKLLTREKKASRNAVSASRVLLAVQARLDGQCGVARAHARAHDALPKELLPRLDADLRWARDCQGGEWIETRSWPASNHRIDELVSLLIVDPLRARASLLKMLDANPDDRAARLALVSASPPYQRRAILDDGLRVAPSSLALHLSLFGLVGGLERVREARQIVATVLPSTIEVINDPRAAASTTSSLFATLSTDPETDSGAAGEEGRVVVAEALVRACGGEIDGDACLEKNDGSLANAVSLLRRKRPSALATDGPRLTNADLNNPRLRLDVVHALLAADQRSKAENLAFNARLRWEGPEAVIAQAASLAAGKKCELARARLAQRPNLATLYHDDVTALKAKCP
ncbi:MAG: hypothetical protein NVSMB1_12410 [Polyangiales bacterium]